MTPLGAFIGSTFGQGLDKVRTAMGFHPINSALCATLCIRGFAAPDLVIADFEGSTYGDWKVEGEAFGAGPALGTLPGQMEVSGFLGHGLVNSYHQGDDSTGTLTSPAFRIERNFIGFFIGGGRNPQQLALQLLVDGKVVRSSTGHNHRPGGMERLEPESWDVSDLIGRNALLRIIDEARGGWGHIHVDHIVQTDTRPAGSAAPASRHFTETTRYLNLPIRNGAPLREVTLLVDGSPVLRNDIELADGEPDWWAPMDISAWQGRNLTLSIDRLPQESRALASIEAADVIKDAENLYREPLRGQFHFSPKRGWLNDPNGMVYRDGEWHLFFQHNPYGWSWGNMHWGHAISRDLVHWEELEIALSPDEMGPMFSGGAVVDRRNTSGLGMEGEAPMILFYTAAGQPTVQCLAYSTDSRRFTKYDGNPILGEITPGNRDPKVIWHEATQRWVMVLWVEVEGANTMQFFTSPNLKEWTFASRIDGFFECPEFFEAAVDGDVESTRWVLMGASGAYRVGHFDGRVFVPDTPMLPGPAGDGFYAAQAFTGAPDGRNVLIGWWRTETRGMPFNQSMSLPLELRLISTAAGPRLSYSPVEELKVLRSKSHTHGLLTLKPGNPNPLGGTKAELVELRATFEPRDANEVIFSLRGTKVVYDAARQELSVGDLRAPAPMRERKVDLTVYVDRTGIEAFASSGTCFIPVPRNADPENLELSVEAKGGTARFESLEIHELRSIWN